MSITDIQRPSGFIETPRKDTYRSPYEDGTVSVRLKWTKTKMQFELSWDVLFDDQKIALEEYIDGNTGLEFIFVHPITFVEYTVILKDDSHSFTSVGPCYWSAKLTLLEK